MKALILVDIQNDFCAGGALAVPDGDAIVPIANALAKNFDLVIATQDWHPSDHKSFASQHADASVGDLFKLNGRSQVAWPDHCVANTKGAEFHGGLNVKEIDRVFQKGTDPEIDSYSGFFDNDHKNSTGLGEFLQSQNVNEVFVLGLATDYCVKFTALDAIKLGLKTTLVLDGCRGVELNSGDVSAAVDSMRKADVSITYSKEIK